LTHLFPPSQADHTIIRRLVYLSHSVVMYPFSSMNTGSTRATSEDLGQISNVIATQNLGGPLESTSSYSPQRSTCYHPAAPALVDDSSYLRPVNLDGEGSAAEDVWYCDSCGDGPYPSWNPTCASCDYKKNTGCWVEDPNVNHTSLHGSPEDDPGLKPEIRWYCDNCDDGPMMDWNPVCSNCGHKRGSCCLTESR
jgi:hypothetical protein